MQYIKPGPRMSAAVVANGFVYTAGQVDATAPDVAGQTRAILAKIDALLAEAGTDKSHAVMANVWLADMASFAELNTVWDAWIDPGRPPARATVESRLAGAQYKVEIALVAALPGERV
jgi:enamine deaminase RidA (YjgF/YER057c/UK114 family)